MNVEKSEEKVSAVSLLQDVCHSSHLPLLAGDWPLHYTALKPLFLSMRQWLLLFLDFHPRNGVAAPELDANMFMSQQTFVINRGSLLFWDRCVSMFIYLTHAKVSKKTSLLYLKQDFLATR